MFIDETKIYVKAGGGGNGCSSLYRDKYIRKGRPDGGPGGGGGDIIFEVDVNVHTLLDFHYRQHLKADSGLHGSSNHKKGQRGADLRIKVPPGTIIKDSQTGLTLRDLVKPGDSVIAARGGPGGKGNSRGHEAEPGAPGEEKTLVLELKMIADAGIIGYPNAGKSTLISRISSARPKIASYPFTTKEPVLGVVRYHTMSFVVADIPGLIEGAHQGRGLGDKFLRHIERTKTLIHIIDAAGVDGRDPLSDYVKLNKELKSYSKELIKKEQLVVLNKIDVTGADENVKKFRKKHRKLKIFPISAVTGEGIDKMMDALYKNVHSGKKDEKK